MIKDYPKTFWVVLLATFIDRVGGFMLFPFFALIMTAKFDVNMVGVGLLFTFFSLGGLLGNTIGGLMTDKFGRKSALLFGLTTSGLSSLAMVYIHDLNLFYILSIIAGTLGGVGEPAQNAIVADLLPQEKHADGYGMIRIVSNISATIGPAFGGFLAVSGFNTLFYADAVTSLITAFIVLTIIPETRPVGEIDAIGAQDQSVEKQSVWETFKGYKDVLSDKIFMSFMLINIFIALAYMQMYSTLAVFLLEEYAFSEQYYGWMISMNALMVVLFQLPITRKIAKKNPFIMMGLGALLYGIGFGMYGFVTSVPMFFLAMVIVTIGEMIIAPFGQTLVANLAPEDKRGRYMALFGFSWMVPQLFGVVLSGYVMDNFNSIWVWIIAGILCFIAMGGLFLLNKYVDESNRHVGTIDSEDVPLIEPEKLPVAEL